MEVSLSATCKPRPPRAAHAGGWRRRSGAGSHNSSSSHLCTIFLALLPSATPCRRSGALLCLLPMWLRQNHQLYSGFHFLSLLCRLTGGFCYLSPLFVGAACCWLLVPARLDQRGHEPAAPSVCSKSPTHCPRHASCADSCLLFTIPASRNDSAGRRSIQHL